MQTKPPFPLFPHNDTEILMPSAVFGSLPERAMNILVGANAQRWDCYQRGTREYFVAVYLPASDAARLLAVCRPMLEPATEAAPDPFPDIAGDGGRPCTPAEDAILAQEDGRL